MATLQQLFEDVGRLREAIAPPPPAAAANNNKHNNNSISNINSNSSGHGTSSVDLTEEESALLVRAVLQWEAAGAFLGRCGLTNLPAVALPPLTQQQHHQNVNQQEAAVYDSLSSCAADIIDGDHTIALLAAVRDTVRLIADAEKEKEGKRNLPPAHRNNANTNSGAGNSGPLSQQRRPPRAAVSAVPAPWDVSPSPSPSATTAAIAAAAPLVASLGPFPHLVSLEAIVASTVRPMALQHESAKVAVAHVRRQQAVALRQWRAARAAAEERRLAALTANVKHAGGTTFTDLTRRAKPEAALFAVGAPPTASAAAAADGSADAADGGDDLLAALLAEHEANSAAADGGGSAGNDSNNNGGTATTNGSPSAPASQQVTDATGRVVSLLLAPPSANTQHDYIVETEAKVRLQSERMRALLPPKMAELSTMVRNGAGATAVAALLAMRAEGGVGGPAAADTAAGSSVPLPLKPGAVTAAAQTAAGAFTEFAAMTLGQQQKTIANENLRRLAVSDENKDIVSALTRPEPVLTLTAAAVRSLFARPPVTFVAASLCGMPTTAATAADGEAHIGGYAPPMGTSAASGLSGASSLTGTVVASNRKSLAHRQSAAAAPPPPAPTSSSPAGLVDDAPSSSSHNTAPHHADDAHKREHAQHTVALPIPADAPALLAQLESTAAAVAALLLEGSQVVVGLSDARGPANGGGGGGGEGGSSTFFATTVIALQAAIAEKVAAMRGSLGLDQSHSSSFEGAAVAHNGGGSSASSTHSGNNTNSPSSPFPSSSSSVASTGLWRCAVANSLAHLRAPVVLPATPNAAFENPTLLPAQLADFAAHISGHDKRAARRGWGSAASSTTTTTPPAAPLVGEEEEESLLEFLSLVCTDRVAAAFGDGQVLDAPSADNTNTTTRASSKPSSAAVGGYARSPRSKKASSKRDEGSRRGNSPLADSHSFSHSRSHGGGHQTSSQHFMRSGSGFGLSNSAFPTPRAATRYLDRHSTTAAVVFVDLDAVSAEAVAECLGGVGVSGGTSMEVDANKQSDERSQTANPKKKKKSLAISRVAAQPQTPFGVRCGQRRDPARAVVSATPLAHLLQVSDAVVVCGGAFPAAAPLHMPPPSTPKAASSPSPLHVKAVGEKALQRCYAHRFVPHLVAAIARAANSKAQLKLHHHNRSGGPSASANVCVPFITNDNANVLLLGAGGNSSNGRRGGGAAAGSATVLRERTEAMSVAAAQRGGLASMAPLPAARARPDGGVHPYAIAVSHANTATAISSSVVGAAATGSSALVLHSSIAYPTAPPPADLLFGGGVVGHSSLYLGLREAQRLVTCLLMASSSSSLSSATTSHAKAGPSSSSCSASVPSSYQQQQHRHAFLVLGDSDADLTLFASSLESTTRTGAASDYAPSLLETIVADVEARAEAILTAIASTQKSGNGGLGRNGEPLSADDAENNDDEDEEDCANGANAPQSLLPSFAEPPALRQRRHDALVRYLLSALLRSSFTHIFVGGKAAPLLKTLHENRVICEEFSTISAGAPTADVVDNDEDADAEENYDAEDGTTAGRPQQKRVSGGRQMKKKGAIPQLPLPANLPTSLVRSCNFLLDVVGTANVRDVDEVPPAEAEAKDAAAMATSGPTSSSATPPPAPEAAKTTASAAVVAVVGAAESSATTSTVASANAANADDATTEGIALGLVASFMGPSASTVAVSSAFRSLRPDVIVASSSSAVEGEMNEAPSVGAIAPSSSSSQQPPTAEAIRKSLEPYPFDHLRRATAATANNNAAQNGGGGGASDSAGAAAAQHPHTVEPLASILYAPSDVDAEDARKSSTTFSSSSGTAAAVIEALLVDWLAAGKRRTPAGTAEEISAEGSSGGEAGAAIGGLLSGGLPPRRPLTLLLPTDVIATRLTQSGKSRSEVRPLLGGGPSSSSSSSAAKPSPATAPAMMVGAAALFGSSSASQQKSGGSTTRARLAGALSSSAATNHNANANANDATNGNGDDDLAEGDALGDTKAGGTLEMPSASDLLGENSSSPSPASSPDAVIAVGGGRPPLRPASAPFASAGPPSNTLQQQQRSKKSGERKNVVSPLLLAADHPAFSIYWFPEGADVDGSDDDDFTDGGEVRPRARLTHPSRYRYADLGPDSLAGLLRWTVPYERCPQTATAQPQETANSSKVADAPRGDGGEATGNGSTSSGSVAVAAVLALGNLTLSTLHERTHDALFPPMPPAFSSSSSPTSSFPLCDAVAAAIAAGAPSPPLAAAPARGLALSKQQQKAPPPLSASAAESLVLSQSFPSLSASHVETLKEVMRQGGLRIGALAASVHAASSVSDGKPSSSPEGAAAQGNKVLAAWAGAAAASSLTANISAASADAPRCVPLPLPLPTLGGLGPAYGQALGAWHEAMRGLINVTSADSHPQLTAEDTSATSSLPRPPAAAVSVTATATGAPATTTAATSAPTTSLSQSRPLTANTNGASSSANSTGGILVDEALVAHLAALMTLRRNATHCCLWAWGALRANHPNLNSALTSPVGGGGESGEASVSTFAATYGGQWSLAHRRMLLATFGPSATTGSESAAALAVGHAVAVGAEPPELWARRIAEAALEYRLTVTNASPSSRSRDEHWGSLGGADVTTVSSFVTVSFPAVVKKAALALLSSAPAGCGGSTVASRRQ